MEKLTMKAEKQTAKRFAQAMAKRIFNECVKDDIKMLETFRYESFLLCVASIEYSDEVKKAIEENNIRLTSNDERALEDERYQEYDSWDESLFVYIWDLIDDKLGKLCEKELEKLNVE